MLCGEPATRYDEADKAIRQRDRHTRTNGGPLTGGEIDSLGCVQVCTGVAGVRVLGNTPGADQNLDHFAHVV